MKITHSKRVVVAMSGGVDSSVAAYLLHQQGYAVIGISLKVWDYDEGGLKRGKTCCSYRDIDDARRVCEKIGIPFYSFDYQKEFRSRVIDPFVAEYLKGRTPNPCILCNNHVKFGELLGEAEKMGAHYLATGHHARLVREHEDRPRLLKGIDAEKDQSYVLYGLSREELKKILLPVGDFTKAEIRTIADRAELPTAQKIESQDICFIPNGDHGTFVRKKLDVRPEKSRGFFVDAKGNTLGEHEGIYHYTIGQRRGLGVATGERVYVVGIDADKNQVRVGSREDLFCSGLVARGVNWIDGDRSFPIECGVKIRYQKNEIPAWVEAGKDDEEIVVRFKTPHPAVTPGQAAVLYRGDEVLGGGTIERAL